MEHPTTAAGTELDSTAPRGTALRMRHSRALNRLLSEREDLRGVHALADLVDDSMRWCV